MDARVIRGAGGAHRAIPIPGARRALVCILGQPDGGGPEPRISGGGWARVDGRTGLIRYPALVSGTGIRPWYPAPVSGPGIRHRYPALVSGTGIRHWCPALVSGTGVRLSGTGVRPGLTDARD